MKEIFASAGRTVMWLALMADESDKVLVEFNRVGGYIYSHGILEKTVHQASLPSRTKNLSGEQISQWSNRGESSGLEPSHRGHISLGLDAVGAAVYRGENILL